VSLDVKESRI